MSIKSIFSFGNGGKSRKSSYRNSRRTRQRHSIDWLQLLEVRIVPSTFTVSELGDINDGMAPLTLREAVAAADNNPGADTVNFALALDGSDIVLGDTVFVGPGTTVTTLRGSTNLDIGVTTSPGVAVFGMSGGTLKGLRIHNGDGVAVNAASERTTLTNVTLDHNGPAITVASGATVLANNITVTESLPGDAAIVVNPGAIFKSNDSTISNNGGVGILNGGDVTLNRVVVEGNDTSLSSMQPGGVVNFGTLLATDSQFINQNVGLNNVSGTVTLKNCLVGSNSTEGLYIQSGSVTVSGGEIANNTLGVLQTGGTFKTTAGLQIVGNAPQGTAGPSPGGGILVFGDSVTTLTDTAVLNNNNAGGVNAQVTLAGGTTSKFTATRVTIGWTGTVTYQAQRRHGLTILGGGTVTVNTSIFFGNSGYGALLAQGATATTSFLSCTLSRNLDGGFGNFAARPLLTVTSSLIVDNFGGAIWGYGAISGGYNIVGASIPSLVFTHSTDRYEPNYLTKIDHELFDVGGGVWVLRIADGSSFTTGGKPSQLNKRSLGGPNFGAQTGNIEVGATTLRLP